MHFKDEFDIVHLALSSYHFYRDTDLLKKTKLYTN